MKAYTVSFKDGSEELYEVPNDISFMYSCYESYTIRVYDGFCFVRAIRDVVRFKLVTYENKRTAYAMA